MEAPRNLEHKPIIVVNEYDKIDGLNANETDAKALSIGIPNYNKEDISVKVWRYDDKNEKWDRQSEEIPVHRAIDLCILAFASFIADVETDYPLTLLKEIIVDKENVKMIKEYFIRNERKLNPRIQELKRILSLFENSTVLRDIQK
jgi:hypothetical protein